MIYKINIPSDIPYMSIRVDIEAEILLPMGLEYIILATNEVSIIRNINKPKSKKDYEYLINMLVHDIDKISLIKLTEIVDNLFITDISGGNIKKPIIYDTYKTNKKSYEKLQNFCVKMDII
mgnify:CR=1 FL=1